MSTKPIDHETYEKIRDEHGELRRAIVEVEQLLGESATAADLDEAFASLSEHILQHFIDEEEAGFFELVVEKAPHFSRKAETLLRQHEALRMQVMTLAQIAHEQLGTETWVARLKERFTIFQGEMEGHESQERELMFDAMDRDIGSKD